jgi:hypothetical protein
MRHGRSVSCPAAHHAANLGAIFGAAGFGIANAAVGTAMAIRQGREMSASQTLSHQLSDAVEAAHAWADLAKAQAAEIEMLKAENERLKKVARQNFEAAQRARSTRAA